MIFLILFGLMIASCQAGNEDFPQPLMFKPDSQDLRRVKVLWNPVLNVTRVFSIAQREVDYGYELGKIQPSAGPWINLVTEADNHDSTRRYALLKKRPCQELQFNVTYQTGEGKIHSGVLQSVEPTAEPWSIDATVTPGEIRYNSTDKLIYLKVNYKVKSTGYPGVEPTAVMPFVQLNQCRTAFTGFNPINLPVVTDKGKTIILPLEYVTHQCEISIQMWFKTFVNESGCYSIFATPQNQSLSTVLACADVKGLKCQKPAQPCNATCEPEMIHAEPKFLDEKNSSNQNLMIRTIWGFSAPGKAYIVRYTPAYNYQDNLMLDLDPSEIVTTNGTFVDLKPFSKLPESVYGLQVCSLHSECSIGKLDWSTVPMHPVVFHQFLQLEPPTEPPSPAADNNSTVVVSHTPPFKPHYKPQKLPKDSFANGAQALSVNQQQQQQENERKTIPKNEDTKKNSSISYHLPYSFLVLSILLCTFLL